MKLNKSLKDEARGWGWSAALAGRLILTMWLVFVGLSFITGTFLYQDMKLFSSTALK